MQQEFEILCITNSTKIQKLEDKVRTLEKKQKKVELQSDDQIAAELQDTVILGGKALPSVSVNEKCDQVATEVIRTKLSISFPNKVIVAAYRLGNKDNEQAHNNMKILVRFSNKQQKNYLISAAKTAKPDDLFASENLTEQPTLLRKPRKSS